MLLEVVDDAVAELRSLERQHREREEARAAIQADRLSFDESARARASGDIRSGRPGRSSASPTVPRGAAPGDALAPDPPAPPAGPAVPGESGTVGETPARPAGGLAAGFIHSGGDVARRGE